MRDRTRDGDSAADPAADPAAGAGRPAQRGDAHSRNAPARAAGPGPAVTDAAVFQRAAALGLALRGRAQMVATVESCTGGLLARALTETAGSSTWFDRGWITYSNDAKIELVGVSPATLDAHGAVSEPTAREMAAGGLARSRAGIAIAVTGIAGPGGAVAGKPVGTVCFAWALRGDDPVCETLCFAGDRTAVRLQAAMHALRRAELLLPADPKD